MPYIEIHQIVTITEYIGTTAPQHPAELSASLYLALDITVEALNFLNFKTKVLCCINDLHFGIYNSNSVREVLDFFNNPGNY
jgi:hypothetical protein